MPKRFMDTGIWQKQWYRKLAPAEKVAWFYLLTSCDAVGMWDADLELAEFSIGQKVDWEELRRAANGNIVVLENGKWWLADFVRFQYGEVNKVSSSRVQQHLCSLLSKHNLWELYEATVAPTVKDKDKDLDKDKDKEERAPGVLLTTSEYDKLVAKYGDKVARQCIDKLSVAKQAKGYKYKSDYAAILNWVIGEVVKRGGVPAGKADGLAWTCGECGATYRSTAATCAKCGWQRP